jgi:hypothetical protein
MRTRRAFVTLLGGAVAWPLAARSQKSMPVIGFLTALSQAETYQVLPFHRGLTHLGKLWQGSTRGGI